MPIPKFANQTYIDFSRPANRRRQEAALAKVRGAIGKEYPIVIGGQRIMTEQKFQSTNPSKPSEVLGVFQRGTAELASRAIESAAAAFETWKRVPAAKRAAVLFRAAKLMQKARLELNAVMMLEVGKSWAEADADTAEAIDFLEFYAREMLRYGADHPGRKGSSCMSPSASAWSSPRGTSLWPFSPGCRRRPLSRGTPSC
jgi:1-pyrroline-5-carboxylate dehydrogenase